MGRAVVVLLPFPGDGYGEGVKKKKTGTPGVPVRACLYAISKSGNLSLARRRIKYVHFVSVARSTHLWSLERSSTKHFLRLCSNEVYFFFNSLPSDGFTRKIPSTNLF